MKKKKLKKYYAIKEGRKSNLIVESWKECEELTQGCKSVFKSFTTREEAESYLRGEQTVPKADQTNIERSQNKVRPKNNKSGKCISVILDNSTYIKFAKKCSDFQVEEDRMISMLINEWISD
ncbi:MAG: RNase H1/viroplasmin domain-containing protein [Bacillota bacterium]|nr:RNase H1/viroplasmin domain-containing protein [Bacillota bacterium]